MNYLNPGIYEELKKICLQSVLETIEFQWFRLQVL